MRVTRAPNTCREGRNKRERSRTRDLARAKKVQKIEIFRELFKNFGRLSRTCSAQAGKCWCMLSTPQTLATKAETSANGRAREISLAPKGCKNSTKIAIFRELFKNLGPLSRACFAHAGNCWCILSTPQTLVAKAETSANGRARKISFARKRCKNN